MDPVRSTEKRSFVGCFSLWSDRSSERNRIEDIGAPPAPVGQGSRAQIIQEKGDLEHEA